MLFQFRVTKKDKEISVFKFNQELTLDVFSPADNRYGTL